MLLTKHAAELCALLVNDLYGELPSRILIALLTKGRSTVAQLIQNTSLGPKHIRNGLGVLIQQNLLYHATSPDSRATNYEANPTACYNIVRYGKILEAVESQYGSAERDLVQTLMLLGHAKVGDLDQAFEARRSHVNGYNNGVGDAFSHAADGDDSLLSVLARLIQAEIIETVRPDSLRNPAEILHEMKTEATKAPPGERMTSKVKAEMEDLALERFREWKDQSRSLKRQLDQTRGSVKRRKLDNGVKRNGHSEDETPPHLNPNIIVRINHEKCLVELRNQSLASFATETLGDATGKVYRVLLDLLTAQLPKCRWDSSLQETAPAQMKVTTQDIYDSLGEDVLLGGIGKTPKEKIDYDSAEKIRPVPPDSDNEYDDSDNENPGRRRTVRVIESDEEDESASDQEDDAPTKVHNSMNGGGQPRVKFEDGKLPKDDRLDKMRQHLLLLAESKHKFVRHCGVVGRGQWTVDFEPLLASLRQLEIDAFIEQCFGRHGLRLTRILREKGKLDEKMLHTAALMKKSEVQGKMLGMQMAGIVDIQEVPKDNMRLANRTMFFWFFDSDKTRSHLLDYVYKAMLRCLQTLQVVRYKDRGLLRFVERRDVEGKEEEVMATEHYNEYCQHLDTQEKLLGQVMRLDDIVGVFRDY